MVSRLIRLLGAMLVLGCLLGAPPASALPPAYVAPSLPPNNPPFALDEFGFSPGGDFFVFQVGSQIRFQRTSDSVITFTQTVVDDTVVGFDVADLRAFLLERVGPNASRLRIADPEAGRVVFDRVMTGVPAVFTTWNASSTVVVETLANGRQRIFVIRASGKVVLQRTASAEGGVVLNWWAPVVVFTEPVPGGGTRLELFNARKGNLLQRETVTGGDLFGFGPNNAAFLVARSAGLNSFRVKLTNGGSNQILLQRNFTGPLSVGFSPDGSLVGVDTVVANQARSLFFRSDTGRQVF